MVHAVSAARMEFAAKRIPAVGVVVLKTAAVNMVVPHPCVVGAVPGWSVRVHVGSASVIVSPAARATLSLKLTVTGPDSLVYGLEI